MKTHKKSAVTVPGYLQKLFVYSVVTAVAVSFFQQLYFAVMQFSSNPNLSSFYITFLVLGLLPLVMFAVAYALVSRKISKSQRIFESLLVAVSAFALQVTLDTLAMSIFWKIQLQNIDTFGSFGLPTVNTLIIIVVASLCLLKLRKSKRW